MNESRVSQLHARAIKRLRLVLAPDMAPAEAMSALKSAVLAFHQKPVMAKASLTHRESEKPVEAPEAIAVAKTPARIVTYKPNVRPHARKTFMPTRVVAHRQVAAAR